MEIENAYTEPFVGYHYFHKQINIAIKIVTASLIQTMSHVSKSANNKELGDLISNADPAWRNPPVWSFSDVSESDIYSFVGELGVVSAFSALDDFFDGVDGEISRCNATIHTSKKLEPSINLESSEEKVLAIYNKYSWKTEKVDRFIPVLKYFRLVRNCIAHRSSKASPALVNYSSSSELVGNFSEYFESKTIAELPRFCPHGIVKIEPKLAIFCSHILREITKSVNGELLAFLGIDGVLYMAAYHGFLKEKPVQTDAYKTPEAVLNFILVDRLNVALSNNTEAISRAAKLGFWKKCIDQYSVMQQQNGS